MADYVDGKTDIGAAAWEYPNGVNPRPHFKALYGNTPVPHPTNSAAKVTHAGAVMSQVMDAK